jgi:hypothetical protein
VGRGVEIVTPKNKKISWWSTKTSKRLMSYWQVDISVLQEISTELFLVLLNRRFSQDMQFFIFIVAPCISIISKFFLTKKCTIY